ncbi:hypothetical protein XELAEV_18023570mg [Xenopus laevis]|uniref:Uncharacterized protein n=1 Tax=Xenopus laevis TaxID=8355 RepID=A0A974D4E0_XENLA|nr:hypothetical protein XELAEV_18023570mg [Xenopus laevis]
MPALVANTSCIIYKCFILTYLALNNSSAPHISSLISRYTANWPLHSNNVKHSSALITLSYACLRDFTRAAPYLCNSLPHSARHSSVLQNFRGKFIRGQNLR